MTQTPYTDAEAVGLYLARTLTADQVSRVTMLIAAATAYIDQRTGSTWNITGATYTAPLTGHDIIVPLVPVTSVTTVETRYNRVGDTWATLTANTDYELIDPTRGRVLINDPAAFAELLPFESLAAWPRHHAPKIVRVTYVPNRPLPADLQDAATQIVGASALSTLFPDRAGISRVQLDPDTVIQYVGSQKLSVPQMVLDVIDQYRPYAVFA